MSETFYSRLVTAVRLLMGADYFVNGLNWWVKLTPYPSISDFVDRPPPNDVVGAMIATGIMFHVVKATELLSGIALLANRFVPLMLVAVFPITVNVFMVDALMIQTTRAYVMGIGALLMNGFLMLAYFGRYRPMFVARGTPDSLQPAGIPLAAAFGGLKIVLGLAAALFGVAIVAWVAVMAFRQLSAG